MAPHPIRLLKATASRVPSSCLAVLLAGFAGWAVAQGQAADPSQAMPVSASASGKVVVAGVVPDEATRVAVLTRLREVYGAERVVDQLSLGSVVAPPNWGQHVQRLISPSLKQVSHGQLSVQGQTVDLRGEVANEAQRQQLVSDVAQALNPTYSVRNGLRVAVREQALVDQALAQRIVEFEAGSAVLRPEGLKILDEMALALSQLQGKRIEVIGHTDSLGHRPGNISLSLARAQAVKSYLVGKGLAAERLQTSGMGPDQPVASNDTEAGRARNRRIEFRVGS
ncbi:OmpA family protein [Aquabacterium parvum]|jgi:OOP family OmpA-OmpF porin|uniref:OmpA family protein n=1 Tax=Aquabacterium parvum TaxID=70584 RepID=UPI0009F9BE7A|nr:OmpA family protein [Aquabacterium parvum]MBU0917436.1 OmpA family protein [Gammaproteobacteria bacterium]